MALFTLQRVIPAVPFAVAAPPAAAAAAAGAPVAAATPTAVAPVVSKANEAAAVDKVTADDKEAVYPEMQYLLGAAAAIVIGVAVGTWAFHHWAKGITFTPPEGMNTFALFYILAQVIERVQEPFTTLVKAPDPDPPQKEGENKKDRRMSQRQARAELEKAVAKAQRDQSQEASRDAANKKRVVDQIRANATVLLFGTSSFLAMLLAGLLRADLIRTIGVSGSAIWVDIALTGVAVGAGTKPLHDLISNLKESKEKKQDPAGTE